jgi:hypothetical protein
VPDPETLSLRVEVVPRSEPIRGHLIDPGGEETRFSGWIELVSALQAAWRTDGPADTRDTRGEGER